MKLFSLLVATVALLVLPANINGAPSIAGSYIVKLKSKTSQAAFQAAVKKHNGQVGTKANIVKYQYDPRILNGVAGTFTRSFVQSLATDQSLDIEYIVPDGIAHTLDGSQDNPPSWGLTRVSQRKLDLKQAYTYPDDGGKGVDVYIVDTGIQANQTDFGGRATFVKSFVANEEATDLNGHGTHCAGTIGSNTYGVAKSVSLFGVKVLNGAGSGTWSDVIAGISFAATNNFDGSRPRVISMSLGGGKNQAVNDAVTNAAKGGVNVIVAAGNNYGQSACDLSPAGADGAMAVAASDNTDTIASFSNKGPCVKIFGPGVDITSLWKGADGATNKISGTSMATPHVAGVAAIYLSKKKYDSPAALYKAMQDAATPNAIKNVDTTTANLLVYNRDH